MTDLIQTHRSAVDFSDPAFRQAATVMGADLMSEFLMAMAAWQRGLRVEFFGNQADARVNIDNMKRSSQWPRLFSVSDGNASHFFEASMGDWTYERLVAASRSKALGKQKLLAAGVSTPAGLLSDGTNLSEVERFLTKSDAQYFVIKPDSGSLGQGVMTQLAKAQVIPMLSTRRNSRTVVEEFVRGTEYRVHVVKDCAIDAYVRTGIFVVGNGYDSIATLIQRKNAARQENPYLRKAPINLAQSTIYLGKFGKNPTMVPVMGERVNLLDVLNISAGGSTHGLASAIPADVAALAVAANKALGLPDSGIDIIHDGTRPYVLELNGKSNIGGHAFPTTGVSGGNAIAEAAIDHYFPARPGTPIQRRNLPLDCTELMREFERNGAKARFLLPALPA